MYTSKRLNPLPLMGGQLLDIQKDGLETCILAILLFCIKDINKP